MKKEATNTTGLMDALVAAQAELETVKGTKENPFHNSTYAGLDDIVQTVLPVLSKHGIAVPQTTSFLRRHIEEGREYAPIILMVTTLHKGDEKISSELPLLGVGNNMQTLGSAVTYARRYGLQAIICSSSSDKDDDGNATLSPEEQRKGQQRAPKRQPAKQQQQPPVAEGGLL